MQEKRAGSLRETMKKEAAGIARVLIVTMLKSSVLGGGRQIAQDFGREVGNRVQEQQQSENGGTI
jgi:hypothetical protein